MIDETKLAVKEEVPIEVLRPVGTNEQIIKAWKDFQALKTVLLTEEDFYSPSQGKQTIRKSGWRKMAVAFGLNDEILSSELEHSPNGVDWTWRIRVRVSSRGGRSVEAIGACSTKERKFAHVEHDTYAMAHTRAKSRAIADMLGAADQLAEEAEDDSPPAKGPEGWTDEQLFAAMKRGK